MRRITKLIKQDLLGENGELIGHECLLFLDNGEQIAGLQKVEYSDGDATEVPHFSIDIVGELEVIDKSLYLRGVK